MTPQSRLPDANRSPSTHCSLLAWQDPVLAAHPPCDLDGTKHRAGDRPLGPVRVNRADPSTSSASTMLGLAPYPRPGTGPEASPAAEVLEQPQGPSPRPPACALARARVPNAGAQSLSPKCQQDRVLAST